MIFCSDLHIGHGNPICRQQTDEGFTADTKAKFKALIDYTIEHQEQLCVAGDFFHKPVVGIEYLNFVCKELARLHSETGKIPIVIAGQHDMPYHSLEEFHRSSIGVLAATGLIDLKMEGSFGNGAYEGDGFVMIHKCVWQGEEPYPGAPPSGNVQHLVRDYPNTLIVAGDNHDPFIAELKGSTVLNCGAMLRTTVRQMDDIPCFYHVIDGNINKIPYPLSDVVLSDEHLVEREKASLTDIMEIGSEVTDDFRTNLMNYAQSTKLCEEVLKTIENLMESNKL